jgi:hypothetical protein
MANHDDPRITSGMDLAAILAEGVLLLQKHHDPRGSVVTDAMTIEQAGAVLFNFYEDWLIALQGNVDSLGAGAAQVLDTRTIGAVTTATINAGASGDFEITVPSTRMSIQWLRCTSNAPSTGGTLQFFADSARTKLVYESDLKMGDPPVDVADFVDGMAWGAFSDDSTGLTDLKLYGTVQNGGVSNSTYTLKLVALGF